MILIVHFFVGYTGIYYHDKDLRKKLSCYTHTTYLFYKSSSTPRLELLAVKVKEEYNEFKSKV